jgi:hypothetical protein
MAEPVMPASFDWLARDDSSALLRHAISARSASINSALVILSISFSEALSAFFIFALSFFIFEA